MKKHNPVPALIAGFLLAAGCLALRLPAGADDAVQTEEVKAYQQAYNLVLAEKWPEAKAALEQFLQKYPKSSWADDARYWQCYCREQNDENRETVFRCYQDFLKAFPDSAWTDEAKTSMIQLAEELAEHGRKEYQTILKTLHADENEEEDIQLTALYALSNMKGDAGIDSILSLYEKSSDSVMRGKIIYILGHSETPKALTKLTLIATKDPSEILRRKAVEALANSESPEAVRVLKTIAQSAQPAPIRRIAISALGDASGAGLTEFLTAIAVNETDPGLAAAAAEAIDEQEGSGKAAAVRRILKEAKTQEAKRAALGLISAKDFPDAPALLKELVLTSKDLEISRQALSEIGELKSAKALEALKDVLTSTKEKELLTQALMAVGEHGGEDALEILKATAIGQSDEDLAEEAAHAMGEFKGGAKRYALLDVLRKSRSIRVKGTVVSMLAEDASAENIQAIGQYLSSETNPDLRERVCDSLGESESDLAVPLLLQIAKTDANSQVRRTATRALSSIGTPKAEAALLELIKK